MYCQHCGREIPNQSRFCSYCGAAQTGQGTQMKPGNSKTLIVGISVIAVAVVALVIVCLFLKDTPNRDALPHQPLYLPNPLLRLPLLSRVGFKRTGKPTT